MEDSNKYADKFKDIKDPEQAELEHLMHKDIAEMPIDVQDRFKALKVLYDQVNAVQEDLECA